MAGVPEWLRTVDPNEEARRKETPAESFTLHATIDGRCSHCGIPFTMTDKLLLEFIAVRDQDTDAVTRELLTVIHRTCAIVNLIESRQYWPSELKTKPSPTSRRAVVEMYADAGYENTEDEGHQFSLFEQGIGAFFAGERIEDCPHTGTDTASPLRRRWWEEGWKAAARRQQRSMADDLDPVKHPEFGYVSFHAFGLNATPEMMEREITIKKQRKEKKLQQARDRYEKRRAAGESCANAVKRR